MKSLHILMIAALILLQTLSTCEGKKYDKKAPKDKDKSSAKSGKKDHPIFGQNDASFNSTPAIVSFAPRSPANIPPFPSNAAETAALRTCGPQKDALENTKRKEEACVLLLTRAAKALGEARKAHGEARDALDRRRTTMEERLRDAQEKYGAMRAMQSRLRRSGREALRNVLRRLIQRFRRARELLEIAREAYERADTVFRATGRRVDQLSLDVKSLEDTLRDVREAILAQRAEYLRCMEGQLPL